jgi:hypothetical protein
MRIGLHTPTTYVPLVPTGAKLTTVSKGHGTREGLIEEHEMEPNRGIKTY